MKISLIIAEIGSTTTIVNAFDRISSEELIFVGQGSAATTVAQGDVTIGLTEAINCLQQSLKVDKIQYDEMFATSSAAGGLRMTVHGLVNDMTVRAAREGALGAGGIIKMSTAGRLTDYDLEEIRAIEPNLILLAGGTDYGERDTALFNAERLAELKTEATVLYAGNVANQRQIKDIFERANKQVVITENVYPRLDQLNIEPIRREIRRAFEINIVKARGMERIRSMVNGSIMPTPGAVMQATRLLYDEIGDLFTVDVGGATTDVHSVTVGSDEIAQMSLSVEPVAKRTVEGDLGVFVNAGNVVDLYGEEKLSAELGFDIKKIMSEYSAIPKGEEQVRLAEKLAEVAATTAIIRHVGTLRHLFTASGRQTVAQGKDLTQVKFLVATGGALTRLPHAMQICDKLTALNSAKVMLYPQPKVIKVLTDSDYVMSCVGVMSLKYPKEALKILKKSLGL